MDLCRSRPSAPTLAAIFGPPVALLVSTVLVTVHTGIDPGFFVRDPASLMGAHSLIGALSHVGVLVWWAAASVCLFGYVVLRRRSFDPTESSFFLCFGAMTVVLTLDDLFRFHDDLVGRYLGLRQRYVFAAYGLASLWCLVRFRAVVARSEHGLLVLAFAFFGLSLWIDGKLFFEPFKHGWLSRWSILLEDGFKLLGIVSWSAYLTRSAFRAMEASVSGEVRAAGRIDVLVPERNPRMPVCPPVETISATEVLPPIIAADAVKSSPPAGFGRPTC